MNLMNTQNLQEEKNDSQAAATPLAAAADSHQPMIEKENPPLTDVPLAAAGSQQPILMSNHGIEEEKKGKDPQVPATNRNLQ